MKRIKAELPNNRNFRNMPDVFVPYPLKFALKHDLSATQTLLYAIIKQYSKLEHKAYTGSIQTLQVMLNGSKSAILNALKTLCDKGYVTKFINNSGRTCYKDNFTEDKKEIYIPFPLRFSIAYNLSSTQTLLYAIIAHYSSRAYGDGIFHAQRYCRNGCGYEPEYLKMVYSPVRHAYARQAPAADNI